MQRLSHGPDDLPVSASALRESIQRHARYSPAQAWGTLFPHQLFECVGLDVRDLLVDRFLQTTERHRQAGAKHLYYLSIEYLLGRSLTNNLINLGIYDLCRDTLESIGVDLGLVEESERDAALGNGGLGRLAACFLDSLATLDIPAAGYGINYDCGLFRQEIDDGNQRGKPDNWRALPTPWEIERPEEACFVPVYGRIEHGVDRRGQYNPMWLNWRLLIGVPHDLPRSTFSSPAPCETSWRDTGGITPAASIAPGPRRRLLPSRRSACVPRDATPSERRIQTPRGVGFQGDPQCCTHRPILQRSHGQGVRPGHLENRRIED